MRLATAQELAELMAPTEVEIHHDNGEQIGPAVVLDNRHATSGCLFGAIKGARVDGHDFATQAVEAGAAAVLSTRVTDAEVPHLVVSDVVEGLSALARGVVRRERERGLISIGITGSSGKTSTKDLVAQVLETHGQTVAPEGSQNNEIGVPLTACRVDENTEYLVSEMGARGIGHIAWLTSLVGLDIGVVLNVGRAHVGEFGGVAATAKAKGEIIECLSADGWAVLNGTDEATVGMAERTQAQVAWFGEGELPAGPLQVQAEHVEVNGLAQPRFTLVVTRDQLVERAAVELEVVGRPQVSNALAAAAIGLIAGMTTEQVAAALSSAKVRSSWRMELHRLDDEILVLNDSYNANPDSVAAAINTAAELGEHQRVVHPQARVFAVLGDMLELGTTAEAEHMAVGSLAADAGITEVIAVGSFAEHIRQGAERGGITARVAERDDIAASLDLRAGDVVIIKGSRGIGLEAVAEALIAGREAK